MMMMMMKKKSLCDVTRLWNKPKSKPSVFSIKAHQLELEPREHRAPSPLWMKDSAHCSGCTWGHGRDRAGHHGQGPNTKSWPATSQTTMQSTGGQMTCALAPSMGTSESRSSSWRAQPGALCGPGGGAKRTTSAFLRAHCCIPPLTLGSSMASFQNEQGALRSWLPTCPLDMEPAETQPGPPTKSPLRNPPSFPKPSAHSSSSRWELPRARPSGCRKCSPAAEAGITNRLGEWQQPWGTGTRSWPPGCLCPAQGMGGTAEPHQAGETAEDSGACSEQDLRLAPL